MFNLVIIAYSICLSFACNANLVVINSAPPAIAPKTWKSLAKQLAEKPELFAFDDRYTVHMGERYDYVDGRSEAQLLRNFLERLSKSPQATDEAYNPAMREKIINLHLQEAGNPLTLAALTQLEKADPSRGYFWILYECACFAGRMQPFRKAVEDTAINHLNEQVAAGKRKKSDPIIITEFAAGKLFPLFMLINRLIALGYHNFVINALDLEYEGLVEYATKQGDAKKLDVGKLFTIDESILVPHIKKLARTILSTAEIVPSPIRHSPLPIQRHLASLVQSLDALQQEIAEPLPNGEEKEQSPVEQLFETHNLYETIKQFMGWFDATKQFSDKTDHVSVTLTLYADAFEYRDACIKDPPLKSDFILALDYWPDQTFPIFEAIVKDGLKPDGLATTVIDIDPRPFAEDEPARDEHYLLTYSNKKASLKRFEGKQEKVARVLAYSFESGKPEYKDVYRLTNVHLTPINAIPPHRRFIKKEGTEELVGEITKPRQLDTLFK